MRNLAALSLCSILLKKEPLLPRVTPILYGKDARRFIDRMKDGSRKETAEQREKRLRDYRLALSILKK